ncbi:MULTISPECIES: hypothetical protein [unclassified Nonomuraea]|uniref:hypothetical protein n=1 Tax=unclassified Nonomuraea TaxID=2593643 RepID=UPI0033C4F47B
MSPDATTAASAAVRRQRAARKEQAARLLRDGITDLALIGKHLGVCERTVQRYLRELEGDVDRRGIVYLEIKPQVLEHLRRYPHLRISAWMLARALRMMSYRPVQHALQSLELDGHVRHEIGTRKEGDYSRAVKVILWSLAEQGQSDGR